jgi:hypothetical protein
LPGGAGSRTLPIMWTGLSGDGPDEEFYRRMSAPENEIPVAVPLNTVLARTADVAVALLGMQVHTTGLAFDLTVRARPGARAANRLDGLFFGPPSTPTHFLLGVELTDGRRVTNLEEPWRPRADRDLVLSQGSGSGSETIVDQSFWLSPLPPGGPFRVVVRCDELAIPETVTELDGTAVRQVAEQVVQLWPWAPPQHDEMEPPPPPDVPPGSWFSR